MQKLFRNQKCWYLFTWTLLTSSAAFDNNLILLCYTWKRSLLIKFWIIIESICAFFLFQVNGQRWPGGTNPGPHSSTWGQSKWHRDVERVDFFFERKKTFPDRIKIFFLEPHPLKRRRKREQSKKIQLCLQKIWWAWLIVIKNWILEDRQTRSVSMKKKNSLHWICLLRRRSICTHEKPRQQKKITQRDIP